MSDENTEIDPIQSAGLDFASLITGDEPAETVTPTADPAETVTDPTETVTPAADPAEIVTPAATEEDENPFEVGKKDDPKPEEDIPDKPTGAPDAWSRLKESRDNHKAASEEKETLLREKESEITELKAKASFIVPLVDHQIEVPRIVNQKIAQEIAVNVQGVFQLQGKS